MIRSPLFSMGLLLLTLGVLILIFPHLLELIVALSLIFFGVSLIGFDQKRRSGQSRGWFFTKNAKGHNKKAN